MRSKVELSKNSTGLKNRQKKIVFIHSLVPLIEVFERLCREMLGDVKSFHILDEPLLKKVQAQGRFLKTDYSRLQSHVKYAEMISSSLAVVTCSTFSPAVDAIRGKVAIPVLKIDENMVARAVDLGSQIGVIATAQSTIQPTENSLQKTADLNDKKIIIKTRLVENALDLLLKGHAQKHDEMVLSTIQELSQEVDVILLSQASLARVLDALPKNSISIPILSSPILVMEQARSMLIAKSKT